MGRSQPVAAVSWVDEGDGRSSAPTTRSPFPPSRGPERPQASAWGDDADEKGGGGGSGVTAASPLIPPPVRASAWGDDSDDDGGVTKTRPSPSPTLAPSNARDTGGVIGGDGAADGAEGERLLGNQQAMPPPSRALTSWGSDEPDDLSSSSPARHSRPLRVAAAVPPPRPSVSPPSASWGNDGGGDDRPFLSRPFLAGAAPVASSPLAGRSASPLAGGVGGGDNGRVVAGAPLSSPFAHQDSGADERLLSWADEDGDEETGDGSLAGSMDGVSPARTPTTPRGGFAFDFAGRVPPLPPRRRQTLASTYTAGRVSTPSTTVPSPWPNSPQGYWTPGGEEDGYPSSLGSTSPTRGGWGGRRFTYSAGLSPRLEPFRSPEGGPIPHPLNHGSRWYPRWLLRQDGGDDNDNETDGQKITSHGGEPLNSTPLPVKSGRGGWFRRAKKGNSRREGGSDGVGVGGDENEDRGPTRKKNKNKNKKKGSGKKGDEEGSGVRTWTFWDNFRSAPGLIARLCACILAVCALWATSLSVAGDVDSAMH